MQAQPGALEPALSAVEGFRVAEGELTWDYRVIPFPDRDGS